MHDLNPVVWPFPKTKRPSSHGSERRRSRRMRVVPHDATARNLSREARPCRLRESILPLPGDPETPPGRSANDRTGMSVHRPRGRLQAVSRQPQGASRRLPAENRQTLQLLLPQEIVRRHCLREFRPRKESTRTIFRLQELAQFSMNPTLESVRVSDSQEEYPTHCATLVFLN